MFYGDIYFLLFGASRFEESCSSFRKEPGAAGSLSWALSSISKQGPDGFLFQPNVFGSHRQRTPRRPGTVSPRRIPANTDPAPWSSTWAGGGLASLGQLPRTDSELPRPPPPPASLRLCAPSWLQSSGEATGLRGDYRISSSATDKHRKTFCYRNRKHNVNFFPQKRKGPSQRSQSQGKCPL